MRSDHLGASTFIERGWSQIAAGDPVAGHVALWAVDEAVLAADAFKNWMLGWRSIFGGEVVSFRKLMDRARREALARLLEDAKRQGYNAVCNVRYDSADVGGAVHARNKNAGKKIAILASGTAYHARKQTAAQMALPGPELNLHSYPVAAASPVSITTP